MEQGVDPITKRRDTRNAKLQTVGSGNTWWKQLQTDSLANRDLIIPEGLPKGASPANQVLRLVVGLLGMEMHEQKDNWAEVWLTFKDESVDKLGLAPGKDVEDSQSIGEKSAEEQSIQQWQLRILQRLRGHVDRRRACGSMTTSPRSPASPARHVDRRRASGSMTTSPQSPASPECHVDRRRVSSSMTTSPQSPASPSSFSDRTPLERQRPASNSSSESLPTSLSSQFSDRRANGGEHGFDGGSAFEEHMELAEFALGRISHAVGALQSPHKSDRPMVLREYTEDKLLEVASDLRQWLEQLATLLSVYHVQILDLEAERTRLENQLQAKATRFSKGEAERKRDAIEHERMQDWWAEMKMKQQAAAMLGIEMPAEETAKEFSQSDVDAILEHYAEEHLEPLREEIKALKEKSEDLQERMREKDKVVLEMRRADKAARVLDDVEEKDPDPQLPKAVEQMLVAALNGVAERISDDSMSQALVKIAESLPTCGVDPSGTSLQDILADIQRTPVYEISHTQSPIVETVETANFNAAEQEAAKRLEREKTEHASMCLSAVVKELDSLAGQLRDCPVASGADRLASLAGWARDTVDIAKTSVESKENPSSSKPLRCPPPPEWDLGTLKKEKKGIRTIGVNTTSDTGDGAESADAQRVRQMVEAEWQERMQLLRQDLEEQVQAAHEATKVAQGKASDAMRRLAEESALADKTLSELRKKMLHLQSGLKAKGLGDQVEAAVAAVGLTDFLDSDHDVFERLYKDALDRMRRLTELQQRIFEKTSQQLLTSLNNYNKPNLALAQLDNRAQPNFALPQFDNRALIHDPRALGIPANFAVGKNERYLGENRKPGVPIAQRSPAKPSPASQINFVNQLHSLQLHAIPPIPEEQVTSALGATRVAAVARPHARQSVCKMPGGLADGECLPSLECRGKGRGEAAIAALRQHKSQPTLAMGLPSTATQNARRHDKASIAGGPYMAIGSIGAAASPSPFLPLVTDPGKQSKPQHARALIGSSSAPQLTSPLSVVYESHHESLE